ncbi:hypothetical protein V3468_00015 [Flavobacterium oreochromis]|uniref:DUF6896 domain-containing protein n=1 Tax=Flavobacterium oreochromis TaxID=2906078 RepID=A0ABW8P541_9FLAO|nr:hypothetical protein [Flavobacterium oreochromis]OWP74763.1 hypothetical protein BWG23_12980 [Flavobacterium oreochromis]QYS87074.1 hypothetical protein JJC03_03650 [Flavobacterium oreochromis]
MKEILDDYVQMIRDFEQKLMAKYQLRINPWRKAGVLFDKIGFINEYSYYYHGSGCTLKKDNILCEYDVTLLTRNEIKFSLWKFFQFVNSHPIHKKKCYDMEYVSKELSLLVEKKFLSLEEIGGKKTGIYQLSDDAEITQSNS